MAEKFIKAEHASDGEAREDFLRCVKKAQDEGCWIGVVMHVDRDGTLHYHRTEFRGFPRSKYDDLIMKLIHDLYGEGKQRLPDDPLPPAAEFLDKDPLAPMLLPLPKSAVESDIPMEQAEDGDEKSPLVFAGFGHRLNEAMAKAMPPDGPDPLDPQDDDPMVPLPSTLPIDMEQAEDVE